MTGILRHASSIAIGDRGILIEGPSGAGKSSLMFGLVERARLRGQSAAIISDDQTLVTPERNGLWLSAPEEIAGKAELRGFGIVEIETVPGARACLLATLEPDEKIERMPEPAPLSSTTFSRQARRIADR